MLIRRAVLAFGVLPLFALGACSSSGPDDGVASAGNSSAKPSATASASLDPADARVKWAECMRQNGVQVRDPGTGSGALVPESGVNPATLQKAQQACQSILQATGTDPNSSAQGTKALDQFLALAKCMREHGVTDFPDPTMDASGEIGFSGKVNRSAPHFKDAQKACKGVGPKGSGVWAGQS